MTDRPEHNEGREQHIAKMAQEGPVVELTILMPCLNEAETLEVCIRKAQGFLQRNEVSGEVLVADNGSTDGSQGLARRCGARVVDVSVRGYGAALFHGTLAARGRYVVMGDADDYGIAASLDRSLGSQSMQVVVVYEEAPFKVLRIKKARTEDIGQ